MDGRVGGWMDGRKGVKAGLRIAYSNQKLSKTIFLQILKIETVNMYN